MRLFQCWISFVIWRDDQDWDKITWYWHERIGESAEDAPTQKLHLNDGIALCWTITSVGLFSSSVICCRSSFYLCQSVSKISSSAVCLIFFPMNCRSHWSIQWEKVIKLIFIPDKIIVFTLYGFIERRAVSSFSALSYTEVSFGLVFSVWTGYPCWNWCVEYLVSRNFVFLYALQFPDRKRRRRYKKVEIITVVIQYKNSHSSAPCWH